MAGIDLAANSWKLWDTNYWVIIYGFVVLGC